MNALQESTTNRRVKSIENVLEYYHILYIKFTHWGRDKMVDILQTTCLLIPMGPIDNKQASVQKMAWRVADNKALYEPKVV